MNETLPLRVRQRLATERAIRDVALRLCAESGMDATTVDHIAEEAGISKRTFFRYFDSKESATVPSRELFHQVFATHLDAVDSLPSAHRALTATLRDLQRSLADDEVELMQRSFALLAGDERIRNAFGSHQAKLSGEVFAELRERVPAARHYELRLMVNATFALDHSAWVHWCETDTESPSLDTLFALHEQAHGLIEGRFD